MARRKSGFKLMFYVAILVLLGWGFWKYQSEILPYFSKVLNYARNYSRNPPEVKIIRELPAEPPALPAGFPLKKLVQKELDLNQDGKKELLVTSLGEDGPRAILVDAADTDRKLSEVFDFSVPEDSPESEFTSEDTPEVFETLDLNQDGSGEIILDLKDYGANTDSFGVLAFKNGKLEWVILQEADGTSRPAIFRDGASAKHASVFKIFETEPRALAQIVGEEGADGGWNWEVEAFSWDGSRYAYNAALSRSILNEQPRRFENGQPVF